MALTTTTHLNFDGDARAALELYQQVFGGELVVVTYAMAHSGDQVDDPERVIFGQVRSEDGFSVMAYDVQHGRSYDQGDHALYVSVRSDSAEQAEAIWNRLSEGSTIITPWGPSVWASGYGMATDRFGVTWFVDVAPEGSGSAPPRTGSASSATTG